MCVCDRTTSGCMDVYIAIEFLFLGNTGVDEDIKNAQKSVTYYFLIFVKVSR